MDRLALDVEPLSSDFGGGAYVRVLVNGHDLLSVRGEFDPDEAQGVASHAIVPLQAKSFPHRLFHGDAGYASSPFDERVPLLHGYYCSACCDLVARITVHSERVDWTNFGRPDLGTRGWRPSPLGDHFGAYVFRRDEYEAALEEAAIEFRRSVPARDVDLAAHIAAVESLYASMPEYVVVHPHEYAELPLVDRDDPEQLAAVVVPRARGIVAAATASIAGGTLQLGHQDLGRLQIWRWELARATAGLEKALANEPS